jgi:hypothetical protein
MGKNRDRKQIEAALCKKGFLPDIRRDHRYYYFFVDGKYILKTKVSHGTQYKNIADTLISQMARQCHLTNSEFIDLVDCTLSQEQYEQLLRNREVV